MIEIVRAPIGRDELQRMAQNSFGEFVKAVVDVERHIMAVGGELHADEEAALLDDGSLQRNLWGINLYPTLTDDAMIEFDSMINVRPSLANRSRNVEDPATRVKIIDIVNKLIGE